MRSPSATGSAAGGRSKRSPCSSIVPSVPAIAVSYAAVWANALRISSKRNARLGVFVERRQQPRVVGRVDDDEHAAKILGGGADERRSADVDLLDERVERRRRIRRRLDERIQVDDDDVDQAEAVPLEGGQIVGRSRRARMPPWSAGCSVFTRPSIISGKPVSADTLGDGRGRRRSARGGAAGRHELEAAGGEAAAQIDDSGLVGDAQQGSWHNRQSSVLSPSDAGRAWRRKGKAAHAAFFCSGDVGRRSGLNPVTRRRPGLV